MPAEMEKTENKPAANALQALCVFQRSTNIKSTQKCRWWDKRSGSDWTDSVKRKETEQLHRRHFKHWTLSLKCHIVLTSYLSLNVIEISAGLAQDSEKRMCYYSNSIIQTMNTNFWASRAVHTWTSSFLFSFPPSTATMFAVPANILFISQVNLV